MTAPARDGGTVLTLAVPTYNRCGVLATTLASLFELAAPHPGIVEIVVCDNGSTDRTQQLCEGFAERSDFRYFRNDVNLGFDANYLKCVEHSRSDYLWIVGDDDELDASAVARVLAHIDRHRPSMIVVNGTTRGRKRIDASQGVEIGDSFDAFFRKYGFHFSWITSTILKKSELRPLDAAEIARSKNFVHLALELKSFLGGGKFLLDLQPLISQRNESVSEYVAQSAKLVDLFGASLCHVVDMFRPGLSRLSSRDFLMRHHYQYGMFDTGFFLKARLDGSLTRKTFFANLKYLRRVSRDWLAGMAIFVLPRTVVETACGQGNKVREKLPGG